MQRGVPTPALLAVLVGLLAVGIVYLAVECQALPELMGPVHGDTSPRTGLGIVFTALGLVALGGGFVLAQRRSRG
jgi:hypothetical protein